MHRRNQPSPQPRPARNHSPGPEHDQQDRQPNGSIGRESMDSYKETRRLQSTNDYPSLTLQSDQWTAKEDFSSESSTPHQGDPKSTSFSQISRQDQKNTLLLVLLYLLQGIPMGLATGSVPFLLKSSHLSYGQIGVFSLAAYPYSLKLLWSPIVDGIWSPKQGRRKSWIVPIQICSGLTMILLGTLNVDRMMKTLGASDGSGVWPFTLFWFFLVFLCATQDIAVDGWALTLLSPENISYASTSQTIGLTAGSFLSYTVFLAFNSPRFANRWFRTTPSDTGLLSLNTYVTFWGCVYLIVTVLLREFKREENTKSRAGVMEVYRHMGGILKLKPVQSIVIIHLFAKIGFQANEAVTNLKLIDKGLSQEDMALTILLDFPVEIGLAYYAAKWSMDRHPIRVWLYAFLARLIAAFFAQGTVMMFPADGMVGMGYLGIVIVQHMFSTLTGTIMFVAIAAFHAKISDPIIGGTYMTLLAT